MVEVLDRVALRTPEDILAALPTLPLEPFSTRELAILLRCSTLLAQRTLYCLRIIGIVESAGKRGRTPLYARTPALGESTSTRAPAGLSGTNSLVASARSQHEPVTTVLREGDR